ncbi:MAG: septal ring lytic transglycosylase RlpA family protein [bacterium]|nr:septal ring lytic transglycosylase RlpA family protein [bacterium]
MKRNALLISLGWLVLAGCSSHRNAEQAFYTPQDWKKPIEAGQAEPSGSFFPSNNNYGNSPKVDPIEPMQASNGFNPNFRGQQETAASPASADAQYGFAPDFENSPKVGQAGQGEQMKGYASWYGPGFHGKATANGERYNQRGMTAAHKILPMGTWVRVTNQKNGESIVVRINDRGPYKNDRIIDLTETAATKLGFVKDGTAPVKLEVVRYPKGYDHAAGLKPYKQVVVQLAVFNELDKAQSYRRSLSQRYGSIPFMVDRKEGSFYVLAGPYDARDDAARISSSLKREGVNNFVRSLRK